MTTKDEPRREPLGGGVAAFVSRAHTFGADALLLADFAAPRCGDRAADLGTGCGIIPLLWFRDDSAPQSAVGVDIQPDAVAQFQMAIDAAGLDDRLSVVCADLRALKGVLPFGAFGLVTCNPPYRRAGSGRPSESDSDRIARHETMCAIGDVCIAAKNLLKSGGRFCCCFPPERLCDLFEAMRANRLEPKRLRLVQRSAADAPWLALVEARRNGGPGLTVQLTINN